MEHNEKLTARDHGMSPYVYYALLCCVMVMFIPGEYMSPIYDATSFLFPCIGAGAVIASVMLYMSSRDEVTRHDV